MFFYKVYMRPWERSLPLFKVKLLGILEKRFRDFYSLDVVSPSSY